MATPERVVIGAESTPPITAPFPWYGGKSRAASLIWERLGNPQNFVEPFAGSLAVLLGRPQIGHIETVNDKDAFVCNVFRALKAAPEAVAHWCDFPVNECQQHAVHTWLLGQRETFTSRLMGNPDYYDAQVAGRWLYGIGTWIGSGWCSGNGPWQSVDGQLVHLWGTGQGVHRQLVHLGDAGQGVHRQLVHLGDAGRGQASLHAWFDALAERLRRVRVCCGEWTRVLGPSVTHKHGCTGVLLDPPYSAEEGRDAGLYAVDNLAVAHAVRQWCVENGTHPLLRVALCGYENVHDELLSHGWGKASWVANGGFSNQRKGAEKNPNKYRETIWFSPACLGAQQPSLFD